MGETDDSMGNEKIKCQGNGKIHIMSHRQRH